MTLDLPCHHQTRFAISIMLVVIYQKKNGIHIEYGVYLNNTEAESECRKMSVTALLVNPQDVNVKLMVGRGKRCSPGRLSLCKFRLGLHEFIYKSEGPLRLCKDCIFCLELPDLGLINSKKIMHCYPRHVT